MVSTVNEKTSSLVKMTSEKDTAAQSGSLECHPPDRRSVHDCDSTLDTTACQEDLLVGEVTPRAMSTSEVKDSNLAKNDSTFVKNTTTGITVNGVNLMNILKNKNVLKKNTPNKKKDTVNSKKKKEPITTPSINGKYTMKNFVTSRKIELENIQRIYRLTDIMKKSRKLIQA